MDTPVLSAVRSVCIPSSKQTVFCFHEVGTKRMLENKNIIIAKLFWEENWIFF
jgi:hypothetical protein